MHQNRVTIFQTDHQVFYTAQVNQPHLDSYNGLGSPVDHVRTYKAQMALATNADELLCLAFPSTLKGPVCNTRNFCMYYKYDISYYDVA